MKKRLIPLLVIMGVISLCLILFILWALMFGVYFLAVLATLGLLIVLPRKIDKEHHWHIRLAAIGGLLVVTLFSSPVWLGQITDRSTKLAKTPRTEAGAKSLSWRHKVGIYGLNGLMGVVGFPLYPEASKETLLMMRKPNPNAIRVFDTNFAMRSKKIAAEVEAFEYALVYEKRDSIMIKKKIVWTLDEYKLGSREARFALALNPAVLQLKAVRQDSSWHIKAAVRVSCEYPKNSIVTLIKKPKLEIEEGLFWMLQEAGWLHPYDAVYTWELRSAKTNTEK